MDSENASNHNDQGVNINYMDMVKNMVLIAHKVQDVVHVTQ
jgi:hypothetical protein